MSPKQTPETPARVASPEKALVGSLILPDHLAQYRPEFEAALKAPELGAWPEGETYVDADGHGPHKVLRVVLRTLHPELPARLKIAVAWRDGLIVRGATAFAAISRASGRLAFFTGLDAVLEVDWALWRGLRAEQRLALIDHEVHHLTWDPESERLGLVGHDVEEFGGILRRWGLWRPNLVAFAAIGREQLELLPDYLVEVATEAQKAPETNGTAPPSPPSPADVRARLKASRGPSKPTAGSKRPRAPMRGSKALRDRAVEPEREETEDPRPPKVDLDDLATLRAAAEVGTVPE